MFDIFKRNNSITLPKDYADLIDTKGYEIFLTKCLSTLKDLGYNVHSFENGDIVYEKENNEQAHFYLDNILRKYLQANEGEKDIEILTHFTKLKDQSKAYEYLYKDFDYAKQFLKVLIKADDILPNNDDFVFQNHFPHLLTFLVLDFEEQFHYVEKNKVTQWEVEEKELFEIALNNIRQEEIEIKQFRFDDKYEVFALFSGDFSASYTLLIEQEFDFAIGKFGSLVALPTKGSAFLYPIDTDNVLDVIVATYPTIEQFFNEDPGNITLNFYWYYQGQFEIFEKTANEDGTVTINNPNELTELFNE
jgi:uncharacterized protein YtpQ (UPF0354 family)